MGVVSFLETENHDFALENGNMVLCRDIRAISSHVEARLRFFLGEWFLDLREGVPYFQDIFVKNPDIALVRSILTRIISETPGVMVITKADFEYDPRERTLFYSVEFTTDASADVSVTIDNAYILTQRKKGDG